METPSISNNLNFNQTKTQKAETNSHVQSANFELKAKGLKFTQNLGQDEFLKLLVTQLKHQDPLSPMNDKDFIAQMAQFSTLKQTTKMNSSIESLINKVSEGGIYSLLGKKVSWYNEITNKMNSGVVESIEKKGSNLGLNIQNNIVDPKILVKIENPVAEQQQEKK